MQNNVKWVTGPNAWAKFIDQHPELGYKPGRMNFHNFLRVNREVLCRQDAIRLAKNKFWIAQQEKFCLVAFECATGMHKQTNAYEPAIQLDESNVDQSLSGEQA
ncbi:MAG: hypothetical protein ACKOWD_09190 [Rhodoferax sp.]